MRAVIGSSILHVSYLGPEANTADELRGCPDLDEAGIGVELATTAGATYAAVWRMDGYNEGLCFGPGTGESRFGPQPLSRSDVSASPGWRQRWGKTVTDVRIGWHIPNEGCPETVESVRLVFEEAASVLIALGQVTADCSIEYQPDAVVVVMDERLGRAYRIPAQTSSAYESP